MIIDNQGCPVGVGQGRVSNDHRIEQKCWICERPLFVNRDDGKVT